MTRRAPGDRVAVNPACLAAPAAIAAGQQNQCLDMRFYGSAMRIPHVQGAFREHSSAPTPRPCDRRRGRSRGRAGRTLAVCLHAVRAGGPLLGGACSSPAAARSARCVIVAARRAGAREIVAPTSLRAARAFAEGGRRPRRSTSPPTPKRWPPTGGQRQLRRAFEASGNARRSAPPGRSRPARRSSSLASAARRHSR